MALETTVTHSPLGCGCAGCAAMDTPAYIGGESKANVPVSASQASSLYSGFKWNTSNGGASKSGKLELEYQFFSNTPSYYWGGAYEQNNFQEFTSGMKSATVTALNMVESFSNLSFVESNKANGNTEIGFGQAQLTSNAGAWAYYPSSSPYGGDVWTNNMYASATQNVQEGTYGFYVILHEIGHALGLQHTHSAGLTGAANTEQYSVMSYDTSTWGAQYAQSFMPYDIKAIQQIYGANTSYNSGNTIYKLQANAAYTIWDGGGKDTLDGSHVTQNMIINLADGAFSSVGLTENIAIAYDAIIENAKGGKGNDTIFGNDTNNVIKGGKGNDTIYASLGKDEINGNGGKDTVVFENNIGMYSIQNTGNKKLEIRFGNTADTDTVKNVETFVFNGKSYSFKNIVKNHTGNNKAVPETFYYGTDGKDVFKGGKLAESFFGGKGGDKIVGGGGADMIDGGGGNKNILHGKNGNDIIINQGKKSKLFGHKGNDEIDNSGKKSMLKGHKGNDEIDNSGNKSRIEGNKGNDEIINSGWKSKIYAGAGNDTIQNEAGKSKLYGGSGNDNIINNAEKTFIGGGKGDDFILNQANKTKVKGGKGDDTLVIQGFKNKYYGGDGADTFIINNTSSPKKANKINDFNADEGDILDVSNILDGYDPGQDAISEFLKITENKKHSFVKIDRDGSGNSFEVFAKITGVTDLGTETNLEAQGILISS